MKLKNFAMITEERYIFIFNPPKKSAVFKKNLNLADFFSIFELMESISLSEHAYELKWVSLYEFTLLVIDF